jgi:hypothetical protein
VFLLTYDVDAMTALTWQCFHLLGCAKHEEVAAAKRI